MRISAIDLGSNAARMIVAEWHGDRFEILKKYRVPLRLGTDVFQTGVISDGILKKAEGCFQEFSEVNHKMGVIKCRAVATSAVRESRNKTEFVSRIQTASKIQLELISGLEEAQLVFTAVKHQINLKRKNAILIDVGGGSVEVTHVQDGSIKNSESFSLGTVRMLEYLRTRKMSEQHIKIVLGDLLKPVVEFFDKKMSGIAFDMAVGTGGNLECMAKLKTQILHDLANESVLTQELGFLFDRLLKTSLRDRVALLGMREDRADVIVPATAVVEMILRQAGIDQIQIPGVGLRDGLLFSMI